MSQDVICGRHVEEQVGQNPTLQIRKTLELERAIAGGHFDIALLAAFKSARRQRFQKVDRPRDARAQLLDRLLIVFKWGCLDTGETSSPLLRGITGNLHLLWQWQHVRSEPRGGLNRGGDFLMRSVFCALLENGREIAERVSEYVYC